MANRRDSLPKVFRIVRCARCGEEFQSTGPNHKRCDPCKREHKREYERANKRATKIRLAACLRCSEPFPPDVHAHKRHCGLCAAEVRREKNNTSQLRRHHERYRHDPARRLHLSVSTLIRRSLKQSKGGRSWEVLVGYTVEDLRAHLERQFVKGMSWANYGTAWHVDHIVPRSAFSFSGAGDPDFGACWALTNLRPLWGDMNLKKGGKRLHLI